jgi:hypothetical protein
MNDQKKKWMGLAAVGTAIAAFVTRLRRRSDRGDRSQKPAVPSDVRS